MEVLVLSVKSYDFKNDDGERVSGNKVTYIMNEEVKEISGFSPMVINVENLEGFEAIPGMYNFDVGMKTGRNNNPVVFVKSAKFVSNVNLFAKVAK